MRDGWIEATLGDVFELTNTRLGDVDVEPAVFSVTKYDGFVLASQYFDKRIASDNLGTYKVVEPGEWAYSTIHIDEGSIARNRHGIRGVVSPMYTTMRVREDAPVMPYFVELTARSPHMLAAYRDNAQGSINRRRSLPWKVFQAMPISLPPLREQQRIVDLIGALDEAIDKVQEGVRAAQQVMAHLRRVEVSGRPVDLGSLCMMRSGPSFKAADVLLEPEPGAVPLLGIPNTPASGQLLLDSISYVRGVPASALRLDESSLVLIRTNGNRSRIGNVYRADRRTAGFVVSAFQIALKPHDPAESAFLYWYLGSPDVQAEISTNASGSTGLGNVAVSWLKSLQIPRLTPDEVVAYVERCEAAGATIAGQAEELQSLETLRGNLLTALLSGAHEIPARYDEFLAEAQ